ncbi:alpha/beta fold hydrolase [Actinomadura welshii]
MDATLETPGPTTPRDAHMTIGGRRFYVREWGPPDAPPAVLLHGIIGNSHEWDTVAARLSAGRRVIVPDQRGHGATDWADDYRAGAFTDDLAALTDALSLDAFDLIGHSLGGIVATLYAARPGSRARTLAVLDIGPETLTDPGVAAAVREMVGGLASASFQSVDEAVAAWIEAAPRARPAETRRWAAHCLHHRPDGTLGFTFDAARLAQFIDDGPNLRLWPALREIPVPALLVRGAESGMLTRECAGRTVSALPDGRLAEIENAGHDLGVENPHEVAAHLTRFLGIP